MSWFGIDAQLGSDRLIHSSTSMIMLRSRTRLVEAISKAIAGVELDIVRRLLVRSGISH
jgi:hypothetical protein